MRRPTLLIASIRTARGIALACALSACTPGSASPPSGTELAAALESLPGIAPRISASSSYRPCTERAPSDGTVVRAECPAGRSDRDALATIARSLAADDEPATVHARAIVDLFTPDAGGTSLERAIASLRTVASSADRPAAALGDLAAALIVRAERNQAPGDLLEAYETTERALAREPGNLVALYNRTLALDRFGLVDEGARTWRVYLAADPRSPWAAEARRRLAELESITPPPPAPAADAPRSAYEGYAAVHPQGAREFGLNHLLSEWAAAVEAGDRATADDRLERAALLGNALERRPGGDASLADAVRAIRSSDDAGRRGLARAHGAYAAAMVLYDSSRFALAEARLAVAAEASARSPALHGWARLFLGTARVHNRAPAEGERILRSVVAGADAARHPALAARARWSLANTLGRMAREDRGLEHAREAARLFARAGENENEGAALSVVSHARFVLGEADSGYAAMHRGLQRLRSHRASVRLQTFFTSNARLVEADGMFLAALSLHTEGVAVASRTGKPTAIAEARGVRARLFAARGFFDRAGEDVRAAREVLPSVKDPQVRGWLAADLDEVEALVSLPRAPEEAMRAAESAAAYFANVPVRAFPNFVMGAEARLAAGDRAGALARLTVAMRLLEQRRDSIRIEPRRAAVFDAARAVIDRIVMLELADGRTVEALRYMDRGRASLASAGGTAPGPDRPAAPPGEVVVEYALVGDTLLAWTVSGSRVEIVRAIVNAAQLERTIEETESKLQRRAPVPELRPLLATLYDRLLRPLEGRLGAPGTRLVIVADGAIAAAPFAALYDARRGRYLVEDRPLRYAVSLREAWRSPAADAASGVLLVADPAFDRRRHPLLDRLPHALDEARGLAAGYRDARLLQGEGATPRALATALPRAGIAHFAGHAVFDDERPERSYLVLAPGAGSRGTTTAEELARMDLRRVRLVVLAACRTVRSGRGRAAGFTGLSGALLAAGAGGTVGSTWDVDDRLTSVLMTEFHRRYPATHDAPGSLRDAQLSMLHSETPALRSPAAWAGFRYAGR